MDTTEKVIVGICSLLAAGGLALWLSDDSEVAEQRELQPAPLAEEEREQPRQPEAKADRDRRDEQTDKQVDPVQAAGDILTSVLKGDRGSGDNKPQEGRSGDSAPADNRSDSKTQSTEKIPVRQPVELQATSETEPIRAESYAATDPYCDLPPSNVATAQVELEFCLEHRLADDRLQGKQQRDPVGVSLDFGPAVHSECEVLGSKRTDERERWQCISDCVAHLRERIARELPDVVDADEGDRHERRLVGGLGGGTAGGRAGAYAARCHNKDERERSR